jgi:hypothetical protein
MTGRRGGYKKTKEIHKKDHISCGNTCIFQKMVDLNHLRERTSLKCTKKFFLLKINKISRVIRLLCSLYLFTDCYISR